MKSVISFFLGVLASASALASPIKIFHERNPERAEWVREIFVSTYQIPEELIVIKEVSKCAALQEKGKLDLCLNDNGDLLVVSVDSGFISESLKIFRTP